MSKDEQLYKDIGDIKECLLGLPYKPNSGLVHDVYDMKKQQCIMQNQLHTLLEEREKNKNKISFSIPKWVSALFGIMVKSKGL